MNAECFETKKYVFWKRVRFFVVEILLEIVLFRPF